MAVMTNITGISNGLKNSEAGDVKFVKSKEDQGINTLHIVWDGSPKEHRGIIIKAVDLGAPDPVLFEESLLHFFYRQREIKGWPSKWPIKNAQFVYSLSLEDDERLRALFPCVKRAIRRYDANLGGFEDSMIGVANTFENMDMILSAPDISQARCTFRSALVLAAGPSLDQEWNNIRQAADSGEFLIIACDVVVKKAIEKGVKPHLIMTTERVPGAEDFLKAMTKEELEGVTLVSTLMAYGVALRNWQGKRTFVVRKDYPAHWYPFKGRKHIWSSPSVVPTALGVLGLLGIKNVALIGQDLCIGKDGRSHSTLSDELEPVRSEMETIEVGRMKMDREEVLTYSGEMRGTTNTWNVMRGDIKVVIDQWQLKAVSTSWHGAKIREVDYEALSEWIKKHSGKTGKLLIWDRNPNEEYEEQNFKLKRRNAIDSLEKLKDNLEKYTPDDLINVPHFCELGLTSCQRSYVTYLNKRFQRNEDRHEFKTLFRAEVYEAIVEVLKILRKSCEQDAK